MRSLSEYRGEEALEVLANLIEPASEIMTDKEIAQLYNSGDRMKAIAVAIKNHKKAVIEVLAALDGQPADKYDVNLFTLPLRLLQILNDKEVAQLFTSQGQMGDAKSFGSVSENEQK